MLRSYISIGTKPLESLREFFSLYQWHNQNVIERAEKNLQNLKPVKKWIEQRLGRTLKNQKILEIGPGQMLSQYYFFADENEVIGVDTDVIITEFDLLLYWKMLHRNGFLRTVKTMGRNILGFDGRYRRAMAKKLGVKQLPLPQIINADIGQVALPDNSFDCVVSFSVFEHLVEPEAAINQISRLLKPGGVSYICIDLYTSDSGCHDPRIFSVNRGTLPYWCHLRPQYEHLAQPNAYMNKISLSEWKKLFNRLWHGWEYLPFGMEDVDTQQQLKKMRESGELAEYTDEELLTKAFAAIWTKPNSPAYT
jgi:ubiquinone/menaquinone biosynthesis C-methylase UbiE